jgi:heme oxygenase
MGDGSPRREPPGPPDVPANVSAYLGALYVLEGSSVGARMLCRDAAKLGYGADYGARHLHRQCEDRTRWPRFLALLEATPDVDRDAALDTAARTFRFAQAAYLG